jgi:integral membrane protein
MATIGRAPDERTAEQLVRLFIVVSVIEAFTWAGLLVGMYLKYVSDTTQLGVRIFGSLHGAAFVCYVVLTVLVAIRLRWSKRLTLVALVASVPPFMTLVFEMVAQRRGRLGMRPRRVSAELGAEAR